MRPSKIEYHVVKLFHKHTKILNNLHNQYIKHVCENGGDILEIGFGGGITADMIQNYNIKTHTIIERDDYFFEELWQWSVDKPNVKVIHGDWVNDIPKNKKYDGIFFDLWNGSEDYARQKKLCDLLDHHTKPGTVFLCATEKAFNKSLYTDKGHKYQEIKTTQPKLKWYQILSHIIRKHSIENGKIIQYLDLIPKVTYKG
tara:strand:+ start:2110 stop:2709 length:600 start_codon:yes stop_codon:yes gene_type:complete